MLVEARLLDHSTPRGDEGRRSPTLEDILFLDVSTARTHGDERLAIYSSHARDQVPVHLTCSHAKVGRIGEDVYSFLPSEQESILREPNIVADTKAELGVLRLES